MSVTIITYFYVGIDITDTSFLWTDVAGPSKCLNGHSHKKNSGDFCDKDGLKFKQENKKIITPKFRELLISDGRDSFKDPDGENDWEEEWQDCTDYDIGPCFNLDESEDEEEYILGIKIGSIDSDDSPKSISFDKSIIDEHMETVREWAEKLGLPSDTEPKLISNLSCN